MWLSTGYSITCPAAIKKRAMTVNIGQQQTNTDPTPSSSTIKTVHFQIWTQACLKVVKMPRSQPATCKTPFYKWMQRNSSSNRITRAKFDPLSAAEKWHPDPKNIFPIHTCCSFSSSWASRWLRLEAAWYMSSSTWCNAAWLSTHHKWIDLLATHPVVFETSCKVFIPPCINSEFLNYSTHQLMTIRDAPTTDLLHSAWQLSTTDGQLEDMQTWSSMLL